MRLAVFVAICGISIALWDASAAEAAIKPSNSKVEGNRVLGPGKHASGHVEVRPGAHMFWLLYFTLATNVSRYYEKPLIIWLQGGPGVSSTGVGNFDLVGPLDIHQKARNYSWVQDYNVLFIDNPVGTGFSYVKDINLLPKTNKQIAQDLVALMRGFYSTLPRFKAVPTYIVGHSYGGKMAVEFALELYKRRRTIETNLKGVGLGNPWISPIDSVLQWAPFLLQMGMVDTNGAKEIEKSANRAREVVEALEWKEATDQWDATQTVVEKVTKGVDFFNVLSRVNTGCLQIDLETRSSDSNDNAPENSEAFSTTILSNLMNGSVKKALNINIPWVSSNGRVFDSLVADFMKPVTHILERLLSQTELKFVVYSGQLDLIVNTPGTVQWIERLKWTNSKGWLASDRLPVVVNNIIEGFSKSFGNLTFYWVNRAGHKVPADNPIAMATILQDLTKH